MNPDRQQGLQPVKRSLYPRFFKGILDVVGSGVVLALFSPVLLIIGAVVRVFIGSPVIFSQERPGLLGRPFHIYKFRTLTNDTDEKGELLPDEARVTRVGQWIRSTSLDELPELVNVLKGDMSLVGPRPLLMRYLPRFSPEQARRHEVKPGVTGWAQVNGRNDLPWDEKLAMDVWYVDHMSCSLDVSILFRTVWKVVRRDGVAKEGHFSSPEFWGTVAKDDRARGM